MLDLSFGLLKFHALYKSIAFCETFDRTVDASLNDMLLNAFWEFIEMKH